MAAAASTLFRLNLSEWLLHRAPLGPRYVKESRALFVPWCVGAVGALLTLIPSVDVPLGGIGTFIFCVGFALTAAQSFGAEFQEQTLGLLLAQPSTRAQLWRDKFTVSTFAGVAMVLLHARTQQLLYELSAVQLALLGVFLLAGVCSLGLWLRILRSVAAAFVVGVATQLVVGVLVVHAIGGSSGHRLELDLHGELGEIIAAGLVYCLALLCLGWSFWRSRLLWLLGAACGLLLVYWLGNWSDAQRTLGEFSSQDVLLAAMVLLATICSSAFWTLNARSTIGGMVFTVGGQCLVAVVVDSTVSKLFPSTFAEPAPTNALIVAVGVVYSLTMVLLGRRTFLHLELKHVGSGEGIAFPDAAASAVSRAAWLAPRPKTPLTNLLRKELRLHLPIFLVAAVFVACCCLILIARMFEPEPRVIFDTILNATIGIYIPVLLLLSGSVSLAEEKTLGLIAWHLTLPVTARRQWWIKVAVGMLTGAVLGLVLPAMLGWLASGKSAGDVGEILVENPTVVVELLPVAGLLLAISFWAAALSGTVVRSVVGGLVAFAGLAGLAAFSFRQVSQLGGLQMGFTSDLVQRFGVSLGLFRPFDLIGIGEVFLVMLIMLWQGCLLFRRVQIAVATKFKCCAILAVLVVVLSAWFADLTTAANEFSEGRMTAEVELAIDQLGSIGFTPTPGTPQRVALSDLERVGRLSPVTKAWLKHAEVTLLLTKDGPRDWGLGTVTIRSPEGKTITFGMSPHGPLGNRLSPNYRK